MIPEHVGEWFGKYDKNAIFNRESPGKHGKFSKYRDGPNISSKTQCVQSKVPQFYPGIPFSCVVVKFSFNVISIESSSENSLFPYEETCGFIGGNLKVISKRDI